MIINDLNALINFNMMKRETTEVYNMTFEVILLEKSNLDLKRSPDLTTSV